MLLDLNMPNVNGFQVIEYFDKNNLFETLGFEYYGPIDGHDINALVNIFEIAKQENRPVFIHTITTKGKGYSFAEVNPKIYHGVSSFDINEGAKVSSTNLFQIFLVKRFVKLLKQIKKFVPLPPL